MMAGYNGGNYGYAGGGYGYAPAPFVGVYDRLSLRPYVGYMDGGRLTRQYVGPVVRGYRTTDGEEQDFYAKANGLVDPAEVRAFGGWNLYRNTADLSATGWLNTTGTLVVGVTTGITDVRGGTEANRLAPAAGTGSAFFRQNTNNNITDDNYTLTIEVKADGCEWLQISGSTGFTNNWQNFNLSTGALGNGFLGTSTYDVTDIGDGWFRISFTIDCTLTTTNSRFVIAIYKTDVATRVAATDTYDGTDAVLIARPQFERASAFSTFEARTTLPAGNVLRSRRYDQFGLGLHSDQAVEAKMPILCEQGVPVTEDGVLAAKHVAATIHNSAVPTSTALFNFLHTTGGAIQSVHKGNNTGANKVLLSTNSSFTANGDGLMFFRLNTNALQVFVSRTEGPTSATSVNDFSTATNTANNGTIVNVDPDNATAASRLFGWENGSPLAGLVNTSTGLPNIANAGSNLTTGSVGSIGVPFDGTDSLLVIWNDLLPTADRVVVEFDTASIFGLTIDQTIVISSQPEASQWVVGDGTIELSITASNVQQYQWQVSSDGGTVWVNVGTNSASLSDPVVDGQGDRLYRCKLTNPTDSATSDSAALEAVSLGGVYDSLSLAPYTGWWIGGRATGDYEGATVRMYRTTDGEELDLDFDPVTGLVDPDEVREFGGWNLLQYSNAIDGAFWSKVAATVNLTELVGPNGLSVYKIIPNTDSTVHYAAQTRTITVGDVYTQTVVAKAGEYNKVQYFNSAFGGTGPTFDLQNGVIATEAWESSEIESLGDGWYRCSASGTAVSTSCSFRIYPNEGVFAGDDVSGIYVEVAQLEKASAFSTYEDRPTLAAGNVLAATIYDQFGLALDSEQATEANMPILCEQGVPVTENGILAAKYVAADARYSAVPSSTALFNFAHKTGVTIESVHQANDTAASKQILRNYNSSTGSGIELRRSTSERIDAFAQRIGGGVPSAGSSINAQSSTLAKTTNCGVIAILDPDNGVAADRAVFYQNGVLGSATNAQTGTPALEDAQGNMTVGASPTGNEPFDGTISRIVIWDDLLPDDDRLRIESESDKRWEFA